MKACKENNYCYNPKLQKNANELRKKMTKPEACLWKYCLKARMMKGYPFRRQRPALKYIADFMCTELLLIIELDGISHHFEDVDENDIDRQKNLEDVGFRVLRFNDEEVLKDLNTVIRKIEFTIEEIESCFHPLNPPPAGDIYSRSEIKLTCYVNIHVPPGA